MSLPTRPPERAPTPTPQPPATGLVLRRGVKRLLDVVGSGLGLLLLSPLFAVVSALIKLDSPGPVFYRWKVVGRNGVPFRSFKFRSMCQDADARKHALAAANEMSGPVFKIANDPRITRSGRWLRRTSIDELPQLWSVLTGQMSLVGPRPPLQSEYARFTPWQRQKLQVRPGLTCLWQVRGRNTISNFDDWVRLDLEYIAQWSLRLDFQILLATVPELLFGRGR